MNGNCGECERRWYCNIDPAVCEKMTKPVPTNGDKIRSMTDEELAEFVKNKAINTLCDIVCHGDCNAVATLKKSGDEACKEIVMKWLQQPAEVDHAQE